MIEAILSLADQNDLAAELGQNGRRAFLRSYESRACCERWVEIAQELLGAPVPTVLPAHASALISDRIANGLEAAA